MSTDTFGEGLASGRKRLRKALRDTQKLLSSMRVVRRQCAGEMPQDALERLEREIEHCARVETYAAMALSTLPDDPTVKTLRMLQGHFEVLELLTVDGAKRLAGVLVR